MGELNGVDTLSIVLVKAFSQNLMFQACFLASLTGILK